MIHQMVRALVVVVAVTWSGIANAAMMEHFDLAGLVVQSASVVIAKRTGPGASTGMSRYSVIRSIRGARRAGDSFEVYDNLYDFEGHHIDPAVILFLAADGHLVSSGMRVVEGDKVFRFEQWNNPGGFKIVPQGKDPEDNWITTKTPIDRGEFERELAQAIVRVELLGVARTATDLAKRRALMLALLPPIGPRARSLGFYVDVVAVEVENALADGGDLEGALEASRRDHSFNSMGRGFGALDKLVAIATDTTKAVELRATALRAVEERSDFVDSEPAGRAAIALLADPAPSIRAAAVVAVARAAEVITSDAKEQARLDRLARDGRTAVSALLAHETDERVRYAIAAASRGKLSGRHTGAPVGANAVVGNGTLEVSVACFERGHHFSNDSKLVVTKSGSEIKLRYSLGWDCNGEGQSTGDNGLETAPPAGRYDMSADLVIDRKHVVIPLGTLVSDGATMTIDHP
jgi:hypothetical protein